LLAEAVTTLERSQSPLELARALTDHGVALRRAGRRIQARAQLERRALDLAHHMGARRIANQAREALIAAGAKPRRDAVTGRDALTVGELSVARLAAQGLTNREIAQALFITTKTAKGHLGHVYRKLEITRRGQLANALTGFLDDDGEGPERHRGDLLIN
jgi:DNA-binding CsgD family transcriptional regulator